MHELSSPRPPQRWRVRPLAEKRGSTWIPAFPPEDGSAVADAGMTGILGWVIIFFAKLFNPNNLHVCRFEPSCSHFARQAIREYGIFKGAFLSLNRLLKCQPFGRPGFDPVPRKS